MFSVLNIIQCRFLSLRENIFSIQHKILFLLDKIEVKVLWIRELALSIVSQNTILRLVLAAIFLIAYLYLLKMFFLLPYILPEYSLIVNVNLKIYIAIIIIALYSLTTEKIYSSRLEMLKDILAAEISTIIGMYFPI